MVNAHASTPTPPLPPPLRPFDVELMPLSGAYAAQAWHWFNDPQVLRTAGIGMQPRTIDAARAWLERRVSDPDGAWFAIELDGDHGAAVVGIVGLRDIDRAQGSAEFAIMVGAANARGRGVGTEATRQLLRAAFSGLGLRQVKLDAIGGNLAGQRAYTRAGFRLAGRLREADLTLSTPQDTVLMVATADTWADPGTVWRPLRPLAVGELFADFAGHWWLAGGWAVDLAIGRQTRAHADTDVEVLRREQAQVGTYLTQRGWQLFAADPPGTLRPWDPASEPTLPEAVHDIWCRPGAAQPWAFQLMLVDTDIDIDAGGDETWVYRRNPSIRRALRDYGWRTSEGLPVVPPEVQLLYRAHSRQQRATNTPETELLLPLLSPDARRWLRAALTLTVPEHAWLQLPGLREGEEEEQP